MGKRKKTPDNASPPESKALSSVSGEQVDNKSNNATPPSFREMYYQSKDSKLLSVITPLGRLLGYGAYSDVYKGSLTGSGQSVVIQVDRRPIISTRESKSEFDAVQRDVTTLKNLNHPSIERLIDWIPDWEKTAPILSCSTLRGAD